MSLENSINTLALAIEQLADAINILAQQGLVETVCLNGQRFDCGSVDEYVAAVTHEYSKRSAQQV